MLWGLLVVAFLSIWQLLNGSAGTRAPTTSDGGGSGVPGLPLWNAAFIAAVALLTLGWAGWLRRRTRAFNEESSRVLELFRVADYAAAAVRFGELAAKYRYPTNLRLTSEFNQAMALLRTGNLVRALEALSELDRQRSRGGKPFRATLASQMAVIYALRAEPAASDRWIAESEKRRRETGVPSRLDGVLALARLVNGIRRDDEAAALSALDESWETIEGTLPVPELRPFRALRAFAKTRHRPKETFATDPGVVEAFAEVRPGELDWLGAEWPELREFLDTVAPRA